MARLQEIYRDKIAPELAKQFGYTSPMQVPRLTKITLNMGVSEAVSDKKVMDNAVADLTKIAGQKPVVTKAKKAIAGFKIRVKEQIIFPEIEYDKVDALRGLNISITTTAKSDEEAKALLAGFRFPFKN